MTRKELTANNLKQSLWDTLQGVQAKEVDPKHANAIASQSREIMRVVRAEIQIAQMTGAKLKGFINAQLPKPKTARAKKKE